MNLLRSEPATFTRGAELRAGSTRIIQLWESRARAAIRSADDNDRLTLRDHLPRFLDRLAAQLDGESTGEAGEVGEEDRGAQRIGQQHGEQRAEDTDYSLDDVIQEYWLLRGAVFEVLEEREALSGATRDLILATFDTSIRGAVTEFVRLQYERITASSERAAQLAKTSEHRERFLVTVVHDLRNPLTAIRLSAELLKAHPERAELCGHVAERTLQGADRLEKMIRDLLDLKRACAEPRAMLRKSECDLVAIASRVCADLSLIYSNPFDIEGAPRAIGIYDPDGIRRVFENLVSNAIKYGDRGSRITIRFDVGDDVACSVHNFGPAIPADHVITLFEVYRRGSDQGVGWGLGLAIVKSFVDLHDGKVEVESDARRGTTFRIRLPRAIGPSLDACPRPAPGLHFGS